MDYNWTETQYNGEPGIFVNAIETEEQSGLSAVEFLSQFCERILKGFYKFQFNGDNESAYCEIYGNPEKIGFYLHDFYMIYIRGNVAYHYIREYFDKTSIAYPYNVVNLDFEGLNADENDGILEIQPKQVVWQDGTATGYAGLHYEALCLVANFIEEYGQFQTQNA